MRARNFGLSALPRKPAAAARSSVLIAQAIADYKKQRQNGTHEDNPERPFPHDGVYDWVSEEDIAYYLKLPPEPNYYRCRYTQGPLDKAWMEERDRNYLARRAREEAQQQDAGAGAATSAAEPVDTDDGHVPTVPAPATTPTDNSAASATPSESFASANSASAAASPSP